MTSAGKVGDDEDPRDAIWREGKEELGIDIVAVLFSESNQRRLISGDDTGEKYTFAILVSRSTLDLIRWHPATGGLVFVDAESVSKIQNLKDFDKATGVTDLNTVAMFSDEKEVVRKALEIDWF